MTQGILFQHLFAPAEDKTHYPCTSAETCNITFYTGESLQGCVDTVLPVTIKMVPSELKKFDEKSADLILMVKTTQNSWVSFNNLH